MPLATLLAWAAALWGGAWVLRRLAGTPGAAGRHVVRALAAGVAAGCLSAGVRAARDAGTGTYTTWGWPRPVYTRWTAWELPPGAPGSRHGGPRPQGLIENGVFYGGAAAALAPALGAARRRLARRPAPPAA